jgi:hypothetical protein
MMPSLEDKSASEKRREASEGFTTTEQNIEVPAGP